MENIKTFNSLEDAITYKPIWPDYDLQYDNFRAGLMSYIRKQDKDGVWHLIPVRAIRDLGTTDNIEQTKQLLQFVKLFTNQCYRVLLFYKFPEKGKELIGTNGRPVGGEVDISQISERERLFPIGDTEITKQAL